MASIKRYHISPNSYPRYRYSAQHVTRLIRQSDELIKKCGIIDLPKVPVFGSVTLNIQVEPNETLLSDKQIECKKSKCVDNPDVIPADKYSGDSARGQTSVFVTSCKQAKQGLPDYSGQLVVFIVDENDALEHGGKLKFPGQELVVYSTAEKFAMTLSLLLERFVFSFIKDRAEILQCFEAAGGFDSAAVSRDVQTMMKQQSQKDAAPSFQVNETKLISLWTDTRMRAWRNKLGTIYKTMPKKYKQQLMPPQDHDGCEKLKHHLCEDVTPLYCQGGAQGHMSPIRTAVDSTISPDTLRAETDVLWKISSNLQYVDKLEQTLQNHFLRIQENMQSIKDTHGEILSMYKRSKVPTDEQPRPYMTTVLLREEIAREVLKVTGATGCGYRHGTLNVFIDEKLPNTESQVKIILKQHDIDDFVVKTEPRGFNWFSDYGVGSKIQTKMYGTLGGFATRNNEYFALLARHVAEQDTCVLVEQNNGKQIQIGTVMEPAGQKGSLDIAAVKLIKKFLKVCDTKFKDLQGEHTVSTLFDFHSGDIGYLQDLPVHIWGQASAPGLGKITIPEYYVPEMEKLVLIEDLLTVQDSSDEESTQSEAGTQSREDIDRFALPGDSGSVVCADDIDGEYVNVISMLMGSKNYTEVKENPNTDQQYLTFRLQSGLEQLNQEHGGVFELC